MLRIAVVAARARVHCADQHEARRIRGACPRSAYGYRSILERLSQGLQSRVPELGQFIQEQNAPMAQRDLARTRYASTADESGVRYRVVRRSEGTVRYQVDCPMAKVRLPSRWL